MKHIQNISETSRKASPRHHWHIIEARDTTETSVGHHRGKTENISETSQQHHQDISVTTLRHHRNRTQTGTRQAPTSLTHMNCDHLYTSDITCTHGMRSLVRVDGFMGGTTWNTFRVDGAGTRRIGGLRGGGLWGAWGLLLGFGAETTGRDFRGRAWGVGQKALKMSLGSVRFGAGPGDHHRLGDGSVGVFSFRFWGKGTTL